VAARNDLGMQRASQLLNSGHGPVSVATSADTPAFAIHAIATWWQTEGETDPR
jgi:hypothetical protein